MLPGRCRSSGIRVLDFSWVIAGPTTTRYLAAMGAEVIKVEAPGRGDPGRASELHTVLGQAKRGIVLDLKKPRGGRRRQGARRPIRRADREFRDRGHGPARPRRRRLCARVNPDLIYVSASGLGRTGPEAHAVAYGTLLQCYAGFAGLNRHPDVPPRVGLAWLDPMCGLMLAFIAAAALWQRRQSGGVARDRFLDDRGDAVDDGRAAAGGPARRATAAARQRLRRCAPHGVWRCAGDDDWLSLASLTAENGGTFARLSPRWRCCPNAGSSRDRRSEQ